MMGEAMRTSREMARGRMEEHHQQLEGLQGQINRTIRVAQSRLSDTGTVCLNTFNRLKLVSSFLVTG